MSEILISWLSALKVTFQRVKVYTFCQYTMLSSQNARPCINLHVRLSALLHVNTYEGYGQCKTNSLLTFINVSNKKSKKWQKRLLNKREFHSIFAQTLACAQVDQTHIPV